MLPLYLSIEGLYSYQQKQEIDFTQLTEAGLFGIFGSVGSGKSSILEAIGYTLYGETERLNSKEKRTYNMLNLKSNHVMIDFQFLNFEGRKFRFIAQWRRKKKFQDITDHERIAYEWIEDNWVPLESNDGALITNLSYPNFRRTIIIPQGQFKEFLELKGKDRSEMMKEIFFLNQYDLGPKVSSMIADNNKRIEHLKGALSGYEEVNEEVIIQKKEQYLLLESALDTFKKEFYQLESQFRSLQIAKQHRLDLDEKRREFSLLEQKKTQFLNLEREVNEFEIVTNNFRENLNNLNSLTLSKNSLLKKIEDLKEKKDAIRSSLKNIEQSIQNILPQFENLDQLKNEIQDFKRLILNLELSKAKNEKEAGIIKGSQFLNEEKKIEEQLNTSIENIDKDIEIIRSKKINAADLLAIDSWYQKQDQLMKDLAVANQRIQENKQQIENLKDNYKSLGYEESNWEAAIDRKMQQLLDRDTNALAKESDLRLKQELAQYIHNLHDGESCPLCGSLEHPSPMQIDSLELDLKMLEAEKTNIILKKEIITKDKEDLQLISRMLVEKQTAYAKSKEEQLTVETVINNHEKEFLWDDFDKNNRSSFDAKKDEVFKIEEQLNQLEKRIKSKREDLQKTRDKIIKSEKRLNDYQNEINIYDAQIKQNIDQIATIDIDLYITHDAETLSEKCLQIESLIRKTEKDYKEFTEQLLEFRTRYAQVKGALTEAQEQYTTYHVKVTEIQTVINKSLLELNYSDIAAVNAILIKELKVIEIRNSINQFNLQYNTLQNRIEELEKLANEESFTEEKFVEVSETLHVKKQELESHIEIYGALKDDLDRLDKEFSKKKELLQSYEQFDSRKKNLDTLFNMFKGNGFVNYVSSIHLQRLCEIANQRFHRLTKNQLSLVINENNEFEVIDYLNDGYRRSAKTLSGGQSFQASLCLALALAENIQSLNKSDKNFFFIDEGFGTQDSESINTVFDTLQYLHQENRVVGIISHVEELKERMPRSITIVKDLDKGSQIVLN